ncbi:MAG: 5-formyltetrahydrofolate cyclo-ligase [Alphaproteobacteria bacterium]
MTEPDKTALRIEARRHRARMDVRAEDPAAASTLFFDTVKPQKGQVVAAYWPAGREFDSRPLIERLLEEGFTCGLPVIVKNERGLRFARWQEDMELRQTDHDVMEPVVNDKTQWLQPDIVIVPLLAFDRRGYRLGQGGGHYDATLSALRAGKKIVAVGLAYAQQACLFNLPVEDHDQKLDWVITPQGASSFNL